MTANLAEHTDVAVRLQSVRREFQPGNVLALDSIDLAVRGGEFLAILGPSGCGKSTLLRMIAGLDQPTRGEIDVPQPSRIAYVFQDAHLLPWRTVLHNVTLPLELNGVDRFHRVSAATEALVAVGLSEFLARYPSQLSGGMRMRVSLARALVTNPNLLLLDEPFAALDEITRQQLDEQLRALWQRRKLTVIFVTHSINEAVFLAERAVVMSKRPGRIVLDKKLALPADRTVATRGELAFARETAELLRALRGSES